MRTSSFIFQGMNSSRVHLRLLLQKPPTLQDWASHTPELNMWFFLVFLRRGAFSCCTERSRIAHGAGEIIIKCSFSMFCLFFRTHLEMHGISLSGVRSPLHMSLVEGANAVTINVRG